MIRWLMKALFPAKDHVVVDDGSLKDNIYAVPEILAMKPDQILTEPMSRRKALATARKLRQSVHHHKEPANHDRPDPSRPSPQVHRYDGDVRAAPASDFLAGSEGVSCSDGGDC